MTANIMAGKLELSRILRYGYAGFLLLGVFLLTSETSKLKSAIDAAGSVLGPIVVLAAGAAIYVLYRYLLGEWLLFPLAHGLDWLMWKFSSRRHEPVSPIWYLATLGVRFGNRRLAYNTVRRAGLEPGIAERLDVAHSEAHIPYLTAVILIAAYGTFARQEVVLLWLGLFTLAAALANDVRQHREELPTLKASVPEQKLKELLKKHGFIT
ncbi:MAG: hypothetical protein JNK02_01020 [Planctomycetes bacterium]|nr:hypothetical protein [Planctomycetota bacterium]